jgi:hypothetical protein
MIMWQAVALKICHDYHLLLPLKNTLAKVAAIMTKIRRNWPGINGVKESKSFTLFILHQALVA